MKMLMLNFFPRTLLQEKLTLETNIYSTSLKECLSVRSIAHTRLSTETLVILITVMSSVTLITEIIKFGRR